MSKVALEVALADVVRWLDYKKVPSFKRTANQQIIDSLAEYVAEGILVIGEDNVVTHNLVEPIQVAGKEIYTLTYKPRLTVSEVKAYTAGVKTNDATTMTLAYVAAMSGQPIQVLERMDTADNSVASTIALFFL